MTKKELYDMSQQQREDLFDSLLKSTQRRGIERVIEYLKKTDFYTCPASTKYHGNYDGGLLMHSLLVYVLADSLYKSLSEISPDITQKITKENIIITTLLHDVCKINTYSKSSKNEKVNGQWRTVETYEYEDKMPFGHGEKSVLMLNMMGLNLEPSEMIAIRWHMGGYELTYGTAQKTFLTAKNNYPLLAIIMTADDVSAHVLEEEVEPKIL